MTKGPKRVFLTPVGDQWNNAWVNARPGYAPEPKDVEYHRADLSADLVRAGYLAGLEAAVEAASNRRDLLGEVDDLDGYEAGAQLCLQDIRALPTDPEAVSAIAAQVMEGRL